MSGKTAPRNRRNLGDDDTCKRKTSTTPRVDAAEIAGVPTFQLATVTARAGTAALFHLMGDRK